MEGTQHKLTFFEKLGYGLGELPGAANSVLAAFLTMFYTDSAGIAAGAVGTMFLISKLFDGITDLIAGSIIDKTKTKWGKARPWLLWLCIPTGLALALIFWVPQNASQTGKLIYAFLTYNLFSSVMYTMVGVAKGALMPLMTQDGPGRGSLATFSLLLGLGGTILGCSATFPFVFKLGGDIGAWRKVFIIYGIIVTIGLAASFLFTKEHVTSVEASAGNGNQTKMTFAEGIKNFVQNKYFLFALFCTIMVNLTLNLNSGSQTYFYTYAMHDPMLMTSLNLVNLIPTIGSILFLGGPCLRFFGKKKCVYIGAAGQIIGYLLRGLAASFGSVPVLMAGTVISALATAPLSIPVNVLAADAVDYGEYLTNKRIEGIGSSVVSFSQKVSTGLAAAAVGWVLQLTGYVPNQDQSAATNFAITTLFAWAPIVLLILLIVAFTLIYHYDEEEPEVLAELERRKHAN